MSRVRLPWLTMVVLFFLMSGVYYGHSTLGYIDNPKPISNSVSFSKENPPACKVILTKKESLPKQSLSKVKENVVKVDNTVKEEITKEPTSSNLDEDVNIERNIKLQQIADLNKYPDVAFLEYIIKVEKQVGLQPCELLALISKETHFWNNTVRDCNDGRINYGPAQIRYAVANYGRKYAVSRGYSTMNSVEDTDLRDREINVFLAGNYLAYLHSVYKDNGEIWTSYNRGEAGMGEYRSMNGHAWSSYARDVDANMELYRNILGQYY